MSYSINDIASLSGYSKKTVSRVLNRDAKVKASTRLKIQSVIDRLGFIPSSVARGLAYGRNLTIALVHDNPNQQNVINFQRSMLERLRATEYALVVDHVDRSSDFLIEQVHWFLTRHRPSAIVLLPPISERQDLVEMCKANGTFYVRVGSGCIGGCDNVIWTDDRAAVKAAVLTLIDNGHRRWGLVRGPSGFGSSHERIMGFLSALEHAGLKLDPGLDFQGDYTFEAGTIAGRQIVNRKFKRMTFFCCNDEMAAGVHYEMRNADIAIPSRIALLGFDNSPTSRHLFPQISTLCWPIEEMANLAVDAVLDQFTAQSGLRNWNKCLMPEYLERGSTG